jgi:hypothetical protein
MPQARSGGSGSTSGAKRTAGRSQAKRSTSSSSGTRAKSTRSSSARTAKSTSTARTAKSTSSARATRAKPSASTGEARVDAVAQRLRKLNERIIEAGKDAGETTLSSYEKALKAIASTIERGPGSSEIDWISNLATAQAKFIRDVTTAWTKAARERLK